MADQALGDAGLLQRNALLAGTGPQSYVDGLLAERDKLLIALNGYRVLDKKAGLASRSSARTSRSPVRSR